MRFVVDEDLSPQVALIGRRLGLDIVHVSESGRTSLPDDQQLLRTGLDGRCIVTKNAADFVILTHQFQTLALAHAGVIVVSRSLDRRDFGGIARALAAYDRDHPDGLPAYAVDFLHAAQGKP